MSTEVKNGQCVDIRDAEVADLESVLALLGQAQLPTAGVPEALPHFLLAEDRGRLVGVVGLELYGEAALLRSAAVEQSWQGSGVGRALIDRALDVARELGVADVFLLTTTAEKYFPRFGFACVGRESVSESVKASAEFQGACPGSAVVMRAKLEPAQ